VSAKGRKRPPTETGAGSASGNARRTLPEEMPADHDKHECLLWSYKMDEGAWVRKLDRLYVGQIILIAVTMTELGIFALLLYLNN
jgi:hypothetical protein